MKKALKGDTNPARRL